MACSKLVTITLLTGLVTLGAFGAGCGTSLNIVGTDGGGGEDTGIDPTDAAATDTGTPGGDTSPTDGKPPVDAAPCVGGSKRLCGDACVDISTSSANCGSCGKACLSGAFCIDGACGACPTALPTACGTACTDTNGDALNCGSCGNKCPSGSVCDSGVCTCGPGLVKCAGGCKDLSKDVTACGSCTTACDAGGSCVSGACTCASGKTMCAGTCVDVKTDPSNCGACGTPCAGVCSGGHCSVPTCRSAAPKVLFYGPLGSMEKPYLPTGAVSVVATETMWRAMTTSDFAGYDLIVLGAPDATTTTGTSDPVAADYVAAYDTRALWGAAVDGRIAVFGMDPAYHAMKGTTGASTVMRSSLKWLTTSVPGATALYVNSDWGTRNLDFLSPFGTFGSTADLYTDTITITVATHPILAGSTDTTLSSWSSSAHSFVTAPSGFTTIATGEDTLSTPPTGAVITVRDAAACTP